MSDWIQLCVCSVQSAVYVYMDDGNCSPVWSATVSVVQESIVVSGWPLVMGERKCMDSIRDSMGYFQKF